MTGIARRLALLGAAVLTAMAFGASSASAQESSIELSDEIFGGHCNPCYLHFTGESVVQMGGFNISHCIDEFEAEVYETGTGHVYHYSGTNFSMLDPCTRQKCNGVGEEGTEVEWPITNPGEISSGESHLALKICLDNKANPNATGFHCDLEVVIEKVPDSHTLRASTIQTCAGMVQVIGAWESEPFGCMCQHDVVEVVHL
jgi:hypothetical protein